MKFKKRKQLEAEITVALKIMKRLELKQKLKDLDSGIKTFEMTWIEYANQWQPFVLHLQRNWDMSYKKGMVTISCPLELYNKYVND